MIIELTYLHNYDFNFFSKFSTGWCEQEKVNSIKIQSIWSVF